MDDVLQAALADSAEIKVEEKSLTAISKMAMRHVELQAWIGLKEKELKDLVDEAKKIEEIDLPNAMLEIGMRTFRLNDGAAINVKKFYGASIKVENRSAAYLWLEAQGHESLIKTKVVTDFGKGHNEREEAKKFKQDLLADGFNASLDESVHHSTLKAFVKEQIEQGVVLPDLFTVFIGERAEITLPKKK
jgi:hypothetical protein